MRLNPFNSPPPHTANGAKHSKRRRTTEKQPQSFARIQPATTAAFGNEAAARNHLNPATGSHMSLSLGNHPYNAKDYTKSFALAAHHQAEGAGATAHPLPSAYSLPIANDYSKSFAARAARATHLPKPPTYTQLNIYKPAFFIIRKLPSTTPFKGKGCKEIIEVVNKVLTTLNAHVTVNPLPSNILSTNQPTQTMRIQVKGAIQLPSGDIKFFVQNRAMATWLLNHKHEWTHLSDPELITKPVSFPVIIHSVSTTFQIESNEFKNNLCTENSLPVNSISNIRWLGDPSRTKKSHGSMVVNFLEKNTASLIEKGGLFYDACYMKGAHYTKAPTQCFNCLEVGHTASFCKNDAFCARCGEKHNSKDCNSLELDNIRCVKCIKKFKTLFPDQAELLDCDQQKFQHSATGAMCPLRKISPTKRIVHIINP